MDSIKLIITASEETCESLDKSIRDHPLIIDTFQDTGFWYSNGETGPEWFTLHIEAHPDDVKEVEELVDNELIKLGKSANNKFWS